MIYQTQKIFTVECGKAIFTYSEMNKAVEAYYNYHTWIHKEGLRKEEKKNLFGN